MDKQTLSLRESEHKKNIEDLQQAQIILKIALTSIEIVEQTLYKTEEKINGSKSVKQIIKDFEEHKKK